MIALSAYKLANYLVDLQYSSDVKWKDVYGLSFFAKADSRNNCFYCLDEGNNLNFFFKQPKAFTKTNLNDMKSEAQFYRFVEAYWKNDLGRYVPKYVRYDTYNGVIVTQYLPGFEQLTSLSSIFCVGAGGVLRRLHELCSKNVVQSMFLRKKSDQDYSEGYSDKHFWLDDFRYYEPLLIRMTPSERKDLLRKNNPYFQQLYAFLVAHNLDLKHWREEWNREVRGIIHGDAAIRNFGMDAGEYKILDFEYVCYGAWFWDLAVLAADLLASSTLPGIWPPRSGNAPADVYPLIVNFCRGYETTPEQQRMILRWAGIYLLQLFMVTEERHHLQFGITLIDHNEECYLKIFEQ